MNEKTLERYLKVRALAERGEGGERTSASTILADLEKAHPGIAEAASAYARSKGRQGPLPTSGSTPDPFPGRGAPPPRRPPPPPPPQQPSRNQGNWENLFRYAQGFYETVKEVVEDASAAQYGRTLAERDVDMTAGSRDRSIFVRLKIPFDTVSEARVLNSLQKESFRKAVHDMLDEYIDAVLQD